MRGALVLVLGLSLVSCEKGRTNVTPVRLFGPVIDNETIAGRANDSSDSDPVQLLMAERALVVIDLQKQSASRHALAMPDASTCWGLARMSDGTVWTICDWRLLRQIDSEGGTVREFPLAAAHVALFGAGDRLLFQRAGFTAPAQALVAGKPGEPDRVPWSTLQTRSFKLARASVAALNLVTCGNTRSEERACWFPDDPAVAMIDAAGHTRRLELPGIPHVAPEVLLTSDNPARPVRDAFVERSGGIWIISAGTAPAGAPQYPGGWLLAHFGPTGAPLEHLNLSEPARLVLRADAHRVVLLLGSGYVAEVRL